MGIIDHVIDLSKYFDKQKTCVIVVETIVVRKSYGEGGVDIPCYVAVNGWPVGTLASLDAAM